MLDRFGIIKTNAKNVFTFVHWQCYHLDVADRERSLGGAELPLTPGEVLRDILSERGWTQDELAQVMGVSRVSIGNLIAGKSGITPEMAMSLAAALKTEPAYWMDLDARYRLSRVRADMSPIERRSRLFQIAPIKEMQRRGWISETSSVEELQFQLSKFFGQPILDEDPRFAVATRKKNVEERLTPAERAWCFEARRLASVFPVESYNPEKAMQLGSKLRRLAAYTKEARKVPVLFAEYGIRFVVIEPIAGAKIDGAAFWLDSESPVIAVSIRYDRIDAFWFTVMHEWAHIKNEDALSVDSNLVGEHSLSGQIGPLQDIELRANQEAAASLVDQDELNSFIRRVGPLYSKQRIVQFAHVIKIHPGIIVGQLQHRGEMGYSANRDILAKVRDVVLETALADGWGHSLSQTTL
jgi:HTH-type transcriptional regulator/antitoxin HigA